MDELSYPTNLPSAYLVSMPINTQASFAMSIAASLVISAITPGRLLSSALASRVAYPSHVISSISPRGSTNFTPLSCTGLWLAVSITPITPDRNRGITPDIQKNCMTETGIIVNLKVLFHSIGRLIRLGPDARDGHLTPKNGVKRPRPIDLGCPTVCLPETK